MGQAKINVGQPDRMISLGVGTLLATIGFRRALAPLVVTALGSYLIYRGLTGNCKVYEALDMDSRDLTLQNLLSGGVQPRSITFETAVTVERPRDEVYLFWRNLDNLPRFMTNLKSVAPQGGNRSHWVAKTPVGGVPVEWDAEVTREIDNEVLSWTSLPGSSVSNSGTVSFSDASGGQGTEVHVHMEYTPPGGAAGAAVAKALNGVTAQSINEDLLRLKQVLETGMPGDSAGQATGGGSAAARKEQKNARERDAAGAKTGRQEDRLRDVVHKASEDSFPASDPPAYSGGVD